MVTRRSLRKLFQFSNRNTTIPEMEKFTTFGEIYTEIVQLYVCFTLKRKPCTMHLAEHVGFIILL